MVSGNLTQMEIPALSEGINLADGHARQSPSPTQRAIIQTLPRLFDEARSVRFDVRERCAQRAFFGALGQSTSVVNEGRVLSAYSSSVAINVVARSLSRRCTTVGLVHPTFDNIPDILRSCSLRLVPISESTLAADDCDARLPRGLDAVFVTTPNNPTGWVLPGPALERLARHCAARGMVLVLDTSFRGFDRRAQYDMYSLLDDVGVDYAVVEDTGKLWPAQELKLGFLAFARGDRLSLASGMSDILLGVSPVVLSLVELLARDAVRGGFDELHRLIARNRRCVARGLGGGACELGDPDSRVSVVRVRLPHGVSASVVWAELRRAGVSMLPCRPFHWSRPHDGDGFLRIALARDSPTVEHGLRLAEPWLRQLSNAAEEVDEPALIPTR